VKVRLSLPTARVEVVNVPAPVPSSVIVPRVVPPRPIVTVPVGVTPVAVTWTVKVTVVPNTAGFAEAVTLRLAATAWIV